MSLTILKPEKVWKFITTSVWKSLIVQLQNKFHVSAAEIDEQDTHQIIMIGVAAIVPHNAMADSLMDDISLFVEENTEAEIIDEEREIR